VSQAAPAHPGAGALVAGLRVYRRRLPVPGRLQIARRQAELGRIVARSFGPMVLRQASDPRRLVELLRTRRAHGPGNPGDVAAGSAAPASASALRTGPVSFSALARPLRRTFEDLGGTFVKLGQLIASTPGLFGDQVANEFRSCLDTGPPVPFVQVCQQIEDDLGANLADVFAELDPEPVGRASIAVVHRGRLLDGRLVAVKVLRPGIEELVATDLDLMQPFIELVARETGDQMAGSALQLVDGLRVQIGEELDLRNEARAMARFRELGEEIALPRLVVPEPFPALSGPNVLTMELLDGIPVDDLGAAAEQGVDPAPLIQDLVRAFFLTAVRWGAFHGDLHAGNLLLLADGRLGIVDWGIVGRLDPATHRFFVRLMEAVVLGDETGWRDVGSQLVEAYGPLVQQGLGLEGPALDAFLRHLVEPTLTRPFGEVSLAALLEAPQVQAARARGIEAHQRSLRMIVGRVRAQRRLHRLAQESGYITSDFDRGTFLLAKQLMYFERYGKLFMADQPLLFERAFFARVLEQRHAGLQ